MDMCAICFPSAIVQLCIVSLCRYILFCCHFSRQISLEKSNFQKVLLLICPLKLSVLNFQACKAEGGQSASNHTDPQASPAKKKRIASPAKVQQRCTSATIPEGWNLESKLFILVSFTGSCRHLGKQL